VASDSKTTPAPALGGGPRESGPAETTTPLAPRAAGAGSGQKSTPIGWQPIETAPTGDAGTRDAPDVLVYAAPAHGLRGFMAVTRWHYAGGWCVDELRPVTHWMPLPEPPR